MSSSSHPDGSRGGALQRAEPGAFALLRGGLPRRIGLDLDHTIAGYDHVFRALAANEGLLPADFRGGVREVEQALLLLPDGEPRWMALQGQAYGRCMPAAELLPGVLDFLDRARARGIELFVVSHRTRRGHFDAAGIDLREAGLAWLRDQGLFERGLAPERVSFHATRDAKVRRIAELELDLFVDDLLSVLLDEAFPARTRRIHLAPPAACSSSNASDAGEPRVEACADWAAVQAVVFSESPHPREPDPESWRFQVERWLATPTLELEELRAGGNNRLFRVRTPRGTSCLKTYLRDARDPRDRFRTELEALEFLQCLGVPQAPRPLHACETIQTLHLEWIEGDPVDAPTTRDVRQAVAFLERLHAQAGGGDARRLPLASEACLSANELLARLERRFERLGRAACLEPELQRLLAEELLPAFEGERDRALEIYTRQGVDPDVDLAPERQTVSPSDFGFHNALRRPDGRLVFLDFESFGRDDPVKLVADFVLHPRHVPFPERTLEFLPLALRLYDADPFLRRRLEALFGLHALRWCGIALGVFLPERRARLRWAGVDQSRTFAESLARVRRLLALLHLDRDPVDET